jgi:ribosomal protein L37AE/L43A
MPVINNCPICDAKAVNFSGYNSYKWIECTNPDCAITLDTNSTQPNEEGFMDYSEEHLVERWNNLKNSTTLMRNIKETEEEVICLGCHNIQTETVRVGDKYAWQCNHCHSIMEGDKFSPLMAISGYEQVSTGGMCRPTHSIRFIPKWVLDIKRRWF